MRDWSRADQDALAESPGVARAGDGSVISGFAHPDFAPVARRFAALYGNRNGGGGALSIRLHGEPVLDVWKGYADPDGARPWTRGTVSVSFSTTKGVASTVIHRLADRGLLGYDEPVATHWPEFARNGKGNITVRDVLTHQAGLHSLKPLAAQPAELLDHLTMEQRLADARAYPVPGRSAYHALTYGWLLAGLARRVTGAGMAELLRTEITQPLGITGLYLGRPSDPDVPIATLSGTALRLAPAKWMLVRTAAKAYTPARGICDAMLMPGVHSLFTGAEPPILATEMAGANGLFTAHALATMYGALANGGRISGRQFLSPETVDAAGRVHVRGRDLALGLPTRWRLGYHQAISLSGGAPGAFGHYGYGGSGGWADPDTGVSVGYVTNNIANVRSEYGLTLLGLHALILEAVRVHAIRRRT